MYLPPNCLNLPKVISEDQFQLTLIWVLAREVTRRWAKRGIYNPEWLWRVDKEAMDVWRQVEQGVSLDEALKIFAPDHLDPMHQTVPELCVQAIRRVLTQGYMLGFDPQTCQMDWIEAAHVGFVAGGGQNFAGKDTWYHEWWDRNGHHKACEIERSIQEWLDLKARHNNEAGVRTKPPYRPEIVYDAVYRCKWPRPGKTCSSRLQISLGPTLTAAPSIVPTNSNLGPRPNAAAVPARGSSSRNTAIALAIAAAAGLGAFWVHRSRK